MRYEEQALELAALKSEFDSRKYSRDVQHMRMIGRKRQLDVSPFTKERADHDEASKRVMRVTVRSGVDCKRSHTILGVPQRAP